MQRTDGILAVPLTVAIMEKELTGTFVARSVAQCRPFTQYGKVRKKRKDKTKCVVEKKAPKRPCTRYDGVRK